MSGPGPHAIVVDRPEADIQGTTTIAWMPSPALSFNYGKTLFKANGLVKSPSENRTDWIGRRCDRWHSHGIVYRLTANIRGILVPSF